MNARAAMHGDDVLAALSALQLPRDACIVVGGAALALRGLRTTDDIDLVVASPLFDALLHEGWNCKARPNGKPGLHRGVFEAYLDVDCGDVRADFRTLLPRAEYVRGMALIDLDTLSALKANYGRDKDLRDLELIRRRREA